MARAGLQSQRTRCSSGLRRLGREARACSRRGTEHATPAGCACAPCSLQVLVSIQSMILGTADPWFNEPGYEGMEGTPR